MRVYLGVTVLMVWLPALAAAADTMPLVQADHPVTVGWRLQGGALELDLALAERTTVQVSCPLRPGLIEISGLTEPADFRYDPATRRLTATLGLGRYCLRMREWARP